MNELDKLKKQRDQIDNEIAVIYQEEEIRMIGHLAMIGYREIKGCPFPHSKELVTMYKQAIEKEKSNYPSVHHHGYTMIIAFFYKQQEYKLSQKELFAIAEFIGIGKRTLYEHFNKYKPAPTDPDYKTWQNVKRMRETIEFK